jgi:uncharacterized protein YjdB
VASIGSSAFSGCSELTDLYCLAKEVPYTGSGAFKDSYVEYATLYVPASSTDAYKAASQWKDFGTIVAIIPATAIALNKSETKLFLGSTLQLTVTVLPEDATDKTITWTSSDPTVATVNKNGLVTPVAAGAATITATTNDGTNLSATCAVTVVIPAASIALNKTESTLAVSAQEQLIVTVLPEDATDKTVTWTSSDPSIATVDENGLVTAVATGVATITATTNDGTNLSATCAVTVIIPATSIALNKTETTLAVSAQEQLIVTVLPEGATDKTVTWTSSNPTVATVDENGLVTAVATGAATITATTNDGTSLEASCAVTVVIPAASIALNKTEATLVIGDQEHLTATVLPANATDKTITWTSSNPTVATVDENGLVTAVAVGFAIITATTNDGTNLEATCEVTAEAPILNYLTLTDAAGLIGANGVLPISMSNTESIKGLQFDLRLPEGVTVATDDYNDLLFTLTSRAHSSHTVSASRLGNGDYRVVVTSLSAKTFSGTEGVIMNVTLSVADNLAAGDYEVRLFSIVLNTADNVSVMPHDATATLTLSDIAMGDVNGDGNINVTDVGMVIDHILENTPSGFIAAAADINSDGVINVTDVGLIIDIILSDNFAREAVRERLEDFLEPQ